MNTHDRDGRRRMIAGRVRNSIVLISVVVVVFYILRFVRISGISPQLVYRIATHNYRSLKQTDGRTSVLLLGISGGNREGSQLTDTMLVATANLLTGSVSLLSVPRDIWSSTLKDKINSAYYHGEQKKKAGGLVLSKVVVEDTIGIPIHYVFRIDFDGFTRLIDNLGGIDVRIPRSFVDTQFPTEDTKRDACTREPDSQTCIYTTVSFAQGIEHMDGKRALTYARSRGEEGSDFARSVRQQEVLLAVKNTVLHPTRWLTPARFTALRALWPEAVEHTATVGEGAALFSLFFRSRTSDTKMVAIDHLFESPDPGSFWGRYVLVPIESWESVHAYVENELR